MQSINEELARPAEIRQQQRRTRRTRAPARRSPTRHALSSTMPSGGRRSKIEKKHASTSSSARVRNQAWTDKGRQPKGLESMETNRGTESAESKQVSRHSGEPKTREMRQSRSSRLQGSESGHGVNSDSKCNKSNAEPQEALKLKERSGKKHKSSTMEEETGNFSEMEDVGDLSGIDASLVMRDLADVSDFEALDLSD